MKHLKLGIALLIIPLTASPLLAQPAPQDYPQSERGPGGPGRDAPPPPDRDQGDRDGPGRDMGPPPPPHRHGDYRHGHVARCADRYRSYNPRTDRVYPPHRPSFRCPL